LFDPGAGGYGGGSGGYSEPYALSFGPGGYSSGGAFGGGGEGSGPYAGGGGGGGVGGGGGGATGNLYYSCAQGGIGGFGGGGGGTGGGTCSFNAAGSVFGGGAGGSNSGIAGNGGNGLGGAIFNQLGEVYLYAVIFSGNTAAGGVSPGGSVGNGLGGAVANLDGELWMTDVTASSDSALNGSGGAGQGSEVYVTSDAGGLTSAAQTPNAALHLVGTPIPSSAIALNQVSGMATVTTSEPVGESGGTFTVTVPITQAGTIGPAPYIVTGGVLTTVYTGAPGSTDFNPVSGGTCTQGATFTVGQTCTVNYSFTPTAVGQREGAVIILNSTFQALGTAFVSDTGQGTQIAFAPGTQSTIAGDWEDGVGGTAVDGYGNIYVAEVYDGTIELISKNQYGGYSPPTVVISGLGMPTSVAVDGAGDIFFTDWLYSSVYELQSYGTLVSLGLDVGWSSPQSVAVDAQGNAFVTDFNQGAVFELPWTGTGFGPSVALPSYNFGYMANVAVDPADNVYVTDNDNNQVVEYPFTASGYGTPIVIPVNTPSLWGIATDGVGNLYLSDSSTGTVMSMLAQPGWQFGPPTTVATGVNSPLGMTVDPNGNIFVAPGGGTQLVEVQQGTPAAINFLTPTQVGLNDTADGTQTVTVASIGNLPLVFNTPSSGANPSYSPNFPVAPGAKGLCAPGSLEPGSTCAVSAIFAPKVDGANQGQVVLTDNGGNGTQTINLTGTAIATPAAMSTPTPGSALSGSSATFTWTTGSGVSSYLLHVGTTGQGSYNVTNTGSLHSTSTTITGIPTTGGTLYVRLYSYIGGAYQYIDYTYTEATSTPSAMTSPAPGSVLTGASATFSWTAGVGVTQYNLHIGTTGAGSTNVATTGSITTLSHTVFAIPTTGATLYVRLYSFISGAWQYIDYTYTEASPGVPAVMSTPAPSSTLSGSSATFTWTAGSQVTQYNVHVGTTGPGSSNIAASGSITALTYSASGIPTSGGALNVRLYSLISGAWQYNDYTYAEASLAAPAVMSTPAPSSTLTGSSATFTWTTGTGVSQYLIHVGTTGPGSYNVVNTGTLHTTSTTIPGIPTTGATLNVRLYSFINSAWQYNDYTYTEYLPPAPATMTSPAQGSTLSGSSATFTWTTGTGVSQYLIHVGTTGPGSYNVVNTGTLHTTSTTITGIPTTGATLNVRLYSFINSAWQYNDYTYTAQ
jgi:hypothetical protein